ncbi:Hypothetical_protein [Hexamita inflata]|uniref:Hypothetical_protein n=1 Tax=Hexamita inflata TaxID=28002 RepID=A0AA86U9Y5_9EUKA|nr:Hypothetical protein HINF_LOCUS32116 [Hexamita inflata]
MSYLRQIKLSDKTDYFDTTTFNELRDVSRGVHRTRSQWLAKRSIHSTQKFVEVSRYDFRSPDPITSELPILQLNNNSSTFSNSKADLPESPLYTQKVKQKKPSVYYGPYAERSLYHSHKAETLPEIKRLMSRGSLKINVKNEHPTKTVFTHNGKWGADLDGIYQWSCCGQEKQNALGCQKKTVIVKKVLKEEEYLVPDLPEDCK